MDNPTYAIHTMGCKLNFYDSEVIGSELERRGFRHSIDLQTADLLLLNTCTVTNNSDSEARNFIRKFKRNNQNGFLVVTGCYVQARKDDVEAMSEVDYVTTNVNKYDVTPIVEAFHGAAEPHYEDHDIMEKRPAEYRILEKFEAKTRAFIKIQDGCNLRCAYCIIPHVRGNNRSVPVDAILEQIDRLEEAGVQEVVLTGIHIGTWGRDLSPKQTFTDLVRAIEQHSSNIWVRISSLDSPEIPDELIEILSSSQKLVPHLHIPLQSGHNQTLRRMRRGYTIEEYADRVQALRATMPHMCLGADVIVGFPGESEEEFAGTESFLKSIPMDYLHVFPYSNRNGTPAASMPDQINGRIIKNRARILREFSSKRRHEHIQRHHQTQRPAILIKTKDPKAPFKALTDNYIEGLITQEMVEAWIDKSQTLQPGMKVLVDLDCSIPTCPKSHPVRILS